MKNSPLRFHDLFRVTAVALSLGALLSLTGCGAVSRGVNKTATLAASLQSPVVMELGARNRPMAAETREVLDLMARELGSEVRTSGARMEALRTWWEKDGPTRLDRSNFAFYEAASGGDPTVIVCISGGGARAARMAAHVMAELEKEYNRTLAEKNLERNKSLMEQIDVYSTVSGGSIYAAFVAMRHLQSVKEKERLDYIEFNSLRESLLVETGTRYPGALSGLTMISPFNLFLPWLFVATTDREYMDILGVTFEWSYKSFTSGYPRLLSPFHVNRGLWTKLGDLPASPQFFFNATDYETGVPFVFSQRVQHVSSENRRLRPAHNARGDSNVATADVAEGEVDALHSTPPTGSRKGRLQVVPLQDVITLEDINSDPGGVTLADAVIASAAFPPVYQPIEFKIHDTPDSRHEIFLRKGFVALVDGGVYDNSGLTTAVKHLEFLIGLEEKVDGAREPLAEDVTNPATDGPRYVLVYINAANEMLSFGDRTRKRWHEMFRPVDLQWPVRGFIQGATSLSMIHTLNKFRVESAAENHLEGLRDRLKGRGTISYYRFELADLAANNSHGELHELIKNVCAIPTEFSIGKSEDRALRRAASILVGSRQRLDAEVWGGGSGGSRGHHFAQDVLQLQPQPASESSVHVSSVISPSSDPNPGD